MMLIKIKCYQKCRRETLSLRTATTPEQHFTQPPARYSEATLIKTLEEME